VSTRHFLWLAPFLALFLVGCSELSAVSELLEPTPEAADPTPKAQPTVQFEVVLVDPTPTALAAVGVDVPPILFVSNRGATGTTDIYQINADGSGLIRLTDDPANESDPLWSPDRRRIAFASDRTGTSQIYLLSIEDFSVAQLTDHPGGAVSPTWSPDGGQIAFVEPDPEGRTILIIESQGGGETTRLPVDVNGVDNLDWAPKGNVIAFSAQADGQDDNRDIFTLDMGVNLLINLTNQPGDDDNPAWAPNGERLAFQTDRDGENNIYVMQANGALQTPLTTDPGSDVEPDWSSDGRLIAFSSDRGGEFDIHVMSESGADQSALAPFEAEDRGPRWPPAPAPSVDELAIAAGVVSDLRDLYIVGAAGTRRSQITASGTRDDTMPDWSPDGGQLVFASNLDGDYDIYVTPPPGTGAPGSAGASQDAQVQAAGSGEPIRLTDHPGADMHPSWSPDGTQIVYEAKGDEGDWDVWVMNADGSASRNLTANEPSHDGNPAWSPDGQRIAFSSNRGGDFDIYVINADGSGDPVRLTRAGGNDFHPAWSPDGTQIAYRSDSETTGKHQIFIVSSEGLLARLLIPSPANDDMPAWSPDGLRVAFASDRASPGAGTQGGKYEIYVFDLATGAIRQVTQGDLDARYPAWRPQKPSVTP
jgi:Tol biopolymer transport system component